MTSSCSIIRSKSLICYMFIQQCRSLSRSPQSSRSTIWFIISNYSHQAKMRSQRFLYHFSQKTNLISSHHPYPLLFQTYMSEPILYINNTCIMSIIQKKYIPFKIRYDFEDRSAKFSKFSQGGTETSIALIIQPLSNSRLGHFDNCRFAIDRAKTLNYFRAMLIGKLSINQATTSIYLFTGKKLLHEGGMTMGELYDRYKDADGFLYINYAENNPF